MEAGISSSMQLQAVNRIELRSVQAWQVYWMVKY